MDIFVFLRDREYIIFINYYMIFFPFLNKKQIQQKDWLLLASLTQYYITIILYQHYSMYGILLYIYIYIDLGVYNLFFVHVITIDNINLYY